MVPPKALTFSLFRSLRGIYEGHVTSVIWSARELIEGYSEGLCVWRQMFLCLVQTTPVWLPRLRRSFWWRLQLCGPVGASRCGGRAGSRSDSGTHWNCITQFPPSPWEWWGCPCHTTVARARLRSCTDPCRRCKNPNGIWKEITGVEAFTKELHKV